MQVIQVSTQPGDQSGSGVLKGTIDSLPKPDERFKLAVIKMSCYSLKLYFKVPMPISCSTVAGAMDVTSQLKENIKI